MCFHCKYGFFVFQTFSMILLVATMMESFPLKSFWLAGLLFVFVAFVSKVNSDERKKMAEKKRAFRETQAKIHRDNQEVNDHGFK